MTLSGLTLAELDNVTTNIPNLQQRQTVEGATSEVGVPWRVTHYELLKVRNVRGDTVQLSQGQSTQRQIFQTYENVVGEVCKETSVLDS